VCQEATTPNKAQEGAFAALPGTPVCASALVPYLESTLDTAETDVANAPVRRPVRRPVKADLAPPGLVEVGEVLEGYLTPLDVGLPEFPDDRSKITTEAPPGAGTSGRPAMIGFTP